MRKYKVFVSVPDSIASPQLYEDIKLEGGDLNSVGAGSTEYVFRKDSTIRLKRRFKKCFGELAKEITVLSFKEWESLR